MGTLCVAKHPSSISEVHESIDLRDSICTPYLDDIVCYQENWRSFKWFKNRLQKTETNFWKRWNRDVKLITSSHRRYNDVKFMEMLQDLILEQEVCGEPDITPVRMTNSSFSVTDSFHNKQCSKEAWTGKETKL